MLDKHQAATNVALIIKSVKGALLDKSRFENALYDLFEDTDDIEAVLAGFDYFALLVKKPKAENACAHLAKTVARPKEEIRALCDVWIDAKFAGKSEADIAGTIYDAGDFSPKAAEKFAVSAEADDEDVEFIATDARPAKSKGRGIAKGKSRAGASRTAGKSVKSMPAGSAPVSAPMRSKKTKTVKSVTKRSLTAADIPPSLRNQQYREVPSGKAYKFLTGKSTVKENYYSTGTKVFFALFLVFGYIATLVTAFFINGAVFEWQRLVVTTVVYAVVLLGAFVLMHRSIEADAPMKWATLLTVPLVLAATGYLRLCELYMVYLIPSEWYGAYLLFVFPMACSVINYLFMRRHLPPKQRLVFVAVSAVLQALLGFGYMAGSRLLALFTTQRALPGVSILYSIYCVLYAPIIYILSRMYSRYDIKFTLVVMILYPIIYQYLRFMMYLGTWIFTLKIDWFIATVANFLIILSVLATYFGVLKGKYIKAIPIFLVIYTLAALLAGCFTAMFAAVLPPFDGQEWVWTLGAAVIVTALLIIARLFVMKLLIPKWQQHRRNVEILRQAEERSNLSKATRTAEDKLIRRSGGNAKSTARRNTTKKK